MSNNGRDIVLRPSYLPERVGRELAQQIQQIELVVEKTRIGTDAFSEVYSYGRYKVATNLARAALLRQALAPQGPSPTELLAQQQLDAEYIN